MKNFREIENLSAYLDGQLNAAETAKLESRLKTDPELASVLSDLRSTRNLLRKLPVRKAPRNFTLTRQMAGLKPPLPRSYPVFRLATVFATILFMCSFTVRTLTPIFSFGFGGAAAPAPAFGMGGGGCDGPCEESAMEAPAATEEAFEYTTEAATEAPAAAEEAPMNASPTSTPEALVDVQSLETEDAARVEQTAVTKEGGSESSAQDQTGESANQPEAQEEPGTPINWTVLFLVIALISGGAMWFIRFSAQRKWR